jgi:hypothetical protein
VGLVALAALLGALVVFLLVRDDDEPAAGGEQPTTTADGGGGDLDIDVPDGFEAFVDEEEGFALALPEEWSEFDLDDPDLEEALDEMADSNPNLADALNQAQAVAASGGVLFAVDPSDLPFAANLNIIKTPGAGGDPAALESVVISQLESVGAEAVSAEVVDLPVGEALRVEYVLPLNLPDGGQVDVHGVQHTLSAGGSTWTITFSTDDIEADEATADAIMESFTAAD